MRPFHIVYVETGYPHPHGRGGAGTYVQLVGRERARRGHKVSVVSAWCPHCPLFTEDEGVAVYRPKLGIHWHWYMGKVPGLRIGALATRYLEHGRKLYRYLETLNARGQIDVVEFAEGGDFWHGLYPTFPYIVHLHGSGYTFKRMSGRSVNRADWYHRWLELFFIRRAQCVVSPSQALLDTTTDESGHSFKHTTVIPYPLDPRLLQDKQPRANKIDSVKTVLFAARNDPVKGAEILLRAVPLVRHELPNVEFKFFGYEPDVQISIPEGVQYHSFLPKEELLKHYQQADLCVIPSLWDNSPNTVYEAMAAALPVVASRTGGIPELVVDGKTGLLFPPGDAKALAKAVVAVLKDPAESRRLGTNGRQRAAQRFELDGIVSSHLQVCEQALAC